MFDGHKNNIIRACIVSRGQYKKDRKKNTHTRHFFTVRCFWPIIDLANVRRSDAKLRIRPGFADENGDRSAGLVLRVEKRENVFGKRLNCDYVLNRAQNFNARTRVSKKVRSTSRIPPTSVVKQRFLESIPFFLKHERRNVFLYFSRERERELIVFFSGNKKSCN